MDEQNRNLLLATGLSVVVMVGWLGLSSWLGIPNGTEIDGTTDEPTAATAPIADTTTAVEDVAPTQPAAVATVADAPRIQIETDRVTGSLSLAGGRIDDLHLRDYKVTQDAGADTVVLLSPEGTAGAYYSTYGWAAAAGTDPADMPNRATLWSSNDTVLRSDNPVTLTWTSPSGLLFTRKISVDENYMFSIEQTVQNNSGKDISAAPYGVLSRHGVPADLKNFFILHEGMIRMSDGELGYTKYKKMPDYDVDPIEQVPADVIRGVKKGWVGLTDHYWMTTLIPEGGFKSASKYSAALDVYSTEAVMDKQTIPAGGSYTAKSQMFAGAKEWATIRAYQNEGGIERFIDSIDWGWFGWLTKPIFWLLHTLNVYVGNMGWSIIGLTLIIKAALLPLAYKSYVSMARMKELQPEMEKLKASAGDDRQKMQQGMMELYKKNKVSPASGCLPILLQIPIFFSLYKVIFVTLELRHAAWFGPFQDLSMPDPTSIMNLFGLLPFSGPEVGSLMATVFIGILPLLLGISMWMQQKLNPAPTDPTQQMIFAWMPWVFMFMLGSFASGLVVYWIANNTITFSQQYLIMRSQGVKPDVFGNIKSSFARKKAED